MPAVALTFHGAGDPVVLTRMLADLKARGARVTVLAVGTWLASKPSMAGQILDAGHELGNHTWSHQTMPRLSAGQTRVEVERGAAELHRLTGGIGAWFRPSGTPHSTALIRAAALRAGYGACLAYDVDPLDYTDPGPELIVRRLGAQVRAGSIVSLHLGHAGTVAAMPGGPAAAGTPWVERGHGQRAGAREVSVKTTRRAGVALAVAGALLATGCSAHPAPAPRPTPSSPSRTPSPTPSAPPAATTAVATNIYAAAGAGMLAPEARLARPLVYVPNTDSNIVDVIDPRTYRVIRSFADDRDPAAHRPVLGTEDVVGQRVRGQPSHCDQPADGTPGRRVSVTDPYNLYFTPDGRHAMVMAERCAGSTSATRTRCACSTRCTCRVAE